MRRPEPSADALPCFIFPIVLEHNQVIELELCPFRNVNYFPREGLQWRAMISMDRSRINLSFPYYMEIPNAFRDPPPGPSCFELLRLRQELM